MTIVDLVAAAGWIAVLAQESTTTTMVPRVVGDPLPTWVILAASGAVLAFIVIGGIVASRRRTSEGERR